jgi:hypothetical protein
MLPPTPHATLMPPSCRPHCPPPCSYVGDGFGRTIQERFIFYRSNGTISQDTSAIQPGTNVVMQSVYTGQYCQLVDLPGAFPLNKGSSRALLQASCLTKGLLCNQPSAFFASVLTYTGGGLYANGVKIAQSPNSFTLLVSNDEQCSIPDGYVYTFPAADGRECCSTSGTACRSCDRGCMGPAGLAASALPDWCMLQCAACCVCASWAKQPQHCSLQQASKGHLTA